MPGSNPSRKWIFASLIASLLGIIDTAILIAHHYRISKQGLMEKSFCTLSNIIDCDTALIDPAAYFISLTNFRIPNAEVGLLFYALITFLSLWALSSPARRKSIFSFILIGSGIGVAFSIYMGSVLYELQTICLFCVTSYVLTLIIFIVGIKLSSMKIWESLIDNRAHLFQYIVVSLIIFGIGILFFSGLNKEVHSGEPKFDKKLLLSHFYRSEPIDIKVPKRPSKGRPEAPITIVEFSDFQCPHCRRAAFSLKPYLGKYRDQVKIVFLNFPLDGSCNPSVKRSMHPTACTAAKATLCAFKKSNKAAWKAHDMIFENQKGLSRHFMTKKVSQAIGMTEDEMSECLVSPEIEDMLKEDVELGIEVQVQGTPAIFINGRLLRAWAIPKVLQTILEAELKRLNSQK